MAQTTFSGPVRSEGGFQTISIAAGTGAVTVTSTYAAGATITDLTASGIVKFTGLPTSNPGVAGQVWNNAGVLNIS